MSSVDALMPLHKLFYPLNYQTPMTPFDCFPGLLSFLIDPATPIS